MKKDTFVIILLAMLFLGARCGDNVEQAIEEDDAGTDTDTDADTDTLQIVPLSSLAILLVIDNSISMAEEQAILADATEPLATALTSTNNVDDIRVAVITTDMGLSWGGNPYQDGDGWPGTNPCSASGDNGVFQACTDPSFVYAETSPGSPNPDFADDIACLVNQGTSGCGFEQQLQSAAVALARPDQGDFVRKGDLLLILMITDESDCSMEDGPGMFATDEIQDESGISEKNIACQSNEEFLYPTSHFAAAFWAASQNAYNAVIFAAITGVPIDDDCQGTGDTLGNCLDHPDMELVTVIKENIQGVESWYFENACTRSTVTDAQPGRRFVDLAVNYFGQMSYIFSICNSDWTPALNDLSGMIGDAIVAN